MSDKISRRKAIIGTMGAALLSALPGSLILAEKEGDMDLSLPPQKHTSLTKHGQYSDSQFFLWSVLSVNNDQSFLSKVDQILNSAGYKSELRYNSNDRYKVAPAKKIIDLVLSSSEVSFKMVLFEGIPAQFKNMSPTERIQLQDRMYSDALGSGLSGNLVTKSEDRYGPSANYNASFSAKHGVTNKTVIAKNDRILQVNDFIGGLCCAILSQRTTKSKIKNEINQYFDSKVGLSAYIGKDLVQINKISVTKVKL